MTTLARFAAPLPEGHPDRDRSSDGCCDQEADLDGDRDGDPLGNSPGTRDHPQEPQIQICHQLPHRLRLGFRPSLSPEARVQIQAALEHLGPPLQVREINQGQGLVIRSDHSPLCPNQFIESIRSSLAQPRVHRVAPPPSRWQLAQAQLRQGSIKVFLALAVAGWVLPILPGTPFFLVAWWLGWRPPAKPPDPHSREPQGLDEPSQPSGG